jgi:hypothetical protein
MLLDHGYRDAAGKMKQFASWFTHGVPNGSHLRKAIYEAKEGPAILARVDEFFERQLAAVPEHTPEALVTKGIVL